jgi:hypothetical protein
MRAHTNHGEFVVAIKARGLLHRVQRRGVGFGRIYAAGKVGSPKRRARSGASTVQMSARNRTACATDWPTLDHLSVGRNISGLEVAGPQVVKGWHGQRFASC